MILRTKVQVDYTLKKIKKDDVDKIWQRFFVDVIEQSQIEGTSILTIVKREFKTMRNEHGLNDFSTLQASQMSQFIIDYAFHYYGINPQQK